MKYRLLTSLAFALGISSQSFAANLTEVYNQALISDPIYQQAIFSRLSTQEGVPISFSSLLPSLTASVNPALSKQTITGAASTFEAGNTTNRGYTFNLNLNQTIFDFGKMANLLGARALSKQADASLSAATQDLMVRVAKAYFAVLQDEDTMLYSKANKDWLKKLLDQIKEQYDVGIKTVTDYYSAKAQYDTADSQYITALTLLQNDRENLRVMTGKLYASLQRLSQHFPYIKPQPANMEDWVKKAQLQNWSIKAEQYAVAQRIQNIRQQFAGHLPNLNFNAAYSNQYAYTSQQLYLLNTPQDQSGPTRTINKSVGMTMNIPLVQGGYVVAQTQKAQYDYQTEMQTLEQTFRNTLNNTRQSYMNIMANISQITADKQAISSAEIALEGMNEGYRVGTKTIVDVLQQQQALFNAQKTYAQDRHDYVINLLVLKQAAGTLSETDLEAINTWLKEGQTLEFKRLVPNLEKAEKPGHLAQKKLNKKVAHKRTKKHTLARKGGVKKKIV